MKLQIIDCEFSVCKPEKTEDINLNDDFCFAGKTDDEISLVCKTQSVPKNTVRRDDGWKGFRIVGTLDFSLIGILSKLSAVLAENKIGIFAVSTFNTDYILVKKDNFEKTVSVLSQNGYEFV